MRRGRRLAAAAVAATAPALTVALAWGVGGAPGVLRGDERVDAAGTPALTADVDGPLFTVGDMVPGDEVERCIALTNASDTPVRLSLFGGGAGGPLAAHLRLRVEPGARPAAAPGSCAGFVSDGGQPVYDGALDAFPADAGSAIADGVSVSAGAARAYRLRVTLPHGVSGIAGLTASQDFMFGAAAEPLPAVTPPELPRTARVVTDEPRINPNDGTTIAAGLWCGRADVPDPVRGGVRPIPGWRGRSVLVRRVLRPWAPGAAARAIDLRVWTNERGRKLVIAVGEHSTMGVAPPRAWRRVAYDFNGEGAVARTTRPYVWQIDPKRVYPGENRVTVRIRTRSGTTVRAVFRFWTSTRGERPSDSVCRLRP